MAGSDWKLTKATGLVSYEVWFIMSTEIPQTVSAFSPTSMVDVLSSSAVPTLYREYEADMLVAHKEMVADGVDVRRPSSEEVLLRG